MTRDRIEAFDTFYKDLFAEIYRYVFRYVGNSQDAEQLAQESFTRFYDFLVNGSDIRNPKPLIYRIAHNACLNFLKREKKFEKIMSRPNDVPLSSNTNEKESIQIEQRATLVRQALKGLPQRDQRCLLLYQEGFSYAEIAEAAGAKKTSIGKILARALERLSRDIRRGEKT